MVSEKGRVVAIDDDALWVETIQQSTCNACAAQKGCGQSVLSKIGIKTTHLRVLLNGYRASDFALNDEVSIGIPDDVIVKSSLLAYLVPIILLVAFSGIAQYTTNNEFYAIAAGVLGLILGGFYIQVFSHQRRHNERYQPILLNKGKKEHAMSTHELMEEPAVIKINGD